MTKADDQRLANLVKKNAAKAAKAKELQAKTKFDSTLPAEQEENLELRQFFRDMKKREF
ncbi:MAG TPA: hypothetical protein VGI83_09550 [Gemmatimonadales bacterium]|jgi:hypothetical protein